MSDAPETPEEIEEVNKFTLIIPKKLNTKLKIRAVDKSIRKNVDERITKNQLIVEILQKDQDEYERRDPRYKKRKRDVPSRESKKNK